MSGLVELMQDSLVKAAVQDAAPELFEALTLLVEWEESQGGDEVPVLRDHLKHCRMALAKARGA